MAPAPLVLLSLSLLAATGRSSPAAPSHLSLSDAQLKQIVQRFAHEDRAGAARALRKGGLRQVLPRLARLQRRTPKDWDLSFELAFTLAYFGVDYQRNVRRLIALDELWDRQDPRWEQYVGMMHGRAGDMRDGIPPLVGALYRHKHDPALLRTLFGWRLDGFAAEILADERYDLLRSYPLQVLRTIQRNQRMEGQAIESIIYAAGPGEWRRTAARVRSSARGADPALRSYARRFLRRLNMYAVISYGQSRRSNALINLRGADLSGMDLGRMGLGRLDLRGANLRNVALENSDLSESNLRGTHLRGARYNRDTRWPAEFDPQRHGAVLVH
jgi:hypothetical protein